MIISEGDRSHRLDYKIDWKKLAQNFFVLEKKTWLSKALSEYPDMEVSSALIAKCKVTYFPNNLSKAGKIWYRYVKNCPDFPFNFDKVMRKLFFEDQNLIIKSTDLSKAALRIQKKGSAAAFKPSERGNGPTSTRHNAGQPLKIRKVKTLYSETLIVDNINKNIATKSNTASRKLNLMENLILIFNNKLIYLILIVIRINYIYYFKIFFYKYNVN